MVEEYGYSEDFDSSKSDLASHRMVQCFWSFET